MRNHTILVLAIYLLAQAVCVAAPSPKASGNYLVQVWRSDEGLPQNWVSSIAQTPDGYLWVGTRFGGLARFDGVRFVNFAPQNTPGLQDVQVERLSVDDEGSLWIAMTNQSVSVLREARFELVRPPRQQPELRLVNALVADRNRILFNEETGLLAVFDRTAQRAGWSTLQPPSPPPTSSYNIYTNETFHKARNGTLWYIDQRQHLAAVPSGAAADRLESPGLDGEEIRALAVDPKGSLWIVTSRQVFSWDGASLKNRTPEGPNRLQNVQQAAFSGDGGLWLLGTDGLGKLHDGGWTVFEEQNLLKTSAASRHCKLYGDSKGGAWVASYGHGLLHTRADGRTDLLTEKEGLPNELVTCWFEDREGNVWIGTTGGGMARIRDRCFFSVGTRDGLPEKVVRSVGVAENGDVWIGTMSGQLARWNENGCEVLPLPPGDVTPIGGITVWPGRHGAIWVGGLYHGLMRYDSGKLARISLPEGPGFILVFCEDRSGALWIGEQGALCRYAGGKLEYFNREQGFQEGIAIEAITEAPDGGIWIGTGAAKLWRYVDGRFASFDLPPDWPASRIVSLRADEDGVVWVGTLGNGLLRFQDGQFTRYRRQNGLPDDNVTQLLDDGLGDLWGGTYAGIFRVKKSDLHEFARTGRDNPIVSTYGRADGLPALECTVGFNPSCWRTRDGILWFSTVNGLVSVDPKKIVANRRPPEVHMEEFQVDGSPRAYSRRRVGTLEIEPGRHFLQFRYTGLSFSAPEKVRFEWKLEGVDRSWQNNGNLRLVGIGPLPPGDYRLRVRACNADGVWNNRGATFAFTVLPYFWETQWFRIAALFAAFGLLSWLVVVLIRRRYRRSLERLRRQHEIDSERARIARDLHDDLGTSLTQISMLSSLASRDLSASGETKDIIAQVNRCARSMVTALDEIVWTVNPKNDSWFELTNYLGSFAEDFFRPTGIRCRMEIPDQLPQGPVSSETRHHLFLAYKEAINNVARHSGAKQVWIRIEIGAAEGRVCIEDDGCGFDRRTTARPGQGNGLANMKRRMEQIGGSAEVRDRADGGTCVAFSIPLRQAAA